MKRTTLLLTLLSVFLFSACSKKDDDDFLQPTFRVDGVTDVTIFPNSSVVLNLEVKYMNAQQERVTLSLEGLPAGMSHELTTTSGFPTFSSFLRISSSGAASGVYPVTLVATGQYSGRHTYTFNVTTASCSAILAKTYTANVGCVTSGSYSETVTAVPGQPDRIQFHNFENSGADIFAQVDCSGGGGGSLQIPDQVVGGVSYSGSGSYWMNAAGVFVSISYMRMTPTDSRSCTITMQ